MNEDVAGTILLWEFARSFTERGRMIIVLSLSDSIENSSLSLEDFLILSFSCFWVDRNNIRFFWAKIMFFLDLGGFFVNKIKIIGFNSNRFELICIYILLLCHMFLGE